MNASLGLVRAVGVLLVFGCCDTGNGVKQDENALSPDASDVLLESDAGSEEEDRDNDDMKYGFTDQSTDEWCPLARGEAVLRGTVTYDTYISGPIELIVNQNESTSCGDEPWTMVSRNPGDQVGQLVLGAPGPFEMKVDLQWSKGNKPPNVTITAISRKDRLGLCAGGGFVEVEGVDQEGIEIVMKDGFCPRLI